MDYDNPVYKANAYGTPGIWIPFGHPESAVLRNLYPVLEMEKRNEPAFPSPPPKEKKPYPDLFEAFWSEYHPDRRIGKRETFAEWKKSLTPAERVSLPKAAAAYTSEAKLKNTDTHYIRHPKRFISTGMFEDYAQRSANRDALKAIAFWDMQFQATMGVAYPWKDSDRKSCADDVKANGLDSWSDKVWFFFAGDNEKVKAAKEELGAHYNTFRHLLTGPLAYSGLKRKAACPHCGNTTGHSYDCPVAVERRKQEEKERLEILAGKAEGLEILKGWKDGR